MPGSNFTTWSALYSQMLDDLASGSWRKMSGYSVAGRSVSYRSFDEFKKLLDYVKSQADAEKGSYQGRTLARPIGRQGAIE